jgi:hypothetical protein
MKRLLPFLMAVVMSGALHGQCADTANIYTFTYGGKVYEVVMEKMNWADAAACAVERDGQLVAIDSEAEQAAIWDAIINGAGISPTYTTINNGGGIAYVWIGATDQQTEGTWIWDGNNSGTGVNFWTGQGAAGAPVAGAYHNWGGKSTGTVNEPDNFGAGQHHGAIGLTGWPAGTTMLGSAGEWNDIIGSSLLYFVVEKDTGSIGVNTTPQTPAIECWPNPAKEVLYMSEVCNVIEVYTLCGRMVLRNHHVKEILLGELPAGIYFVRLEAGNQTVVRRIVVQ